MYTESVLLTELRRNMMSELRLHAFFAMQKIPRNYNAFYLTLCKECDI